MQFDEVLSRQGWSSDALIEADERMGAGWCLAPAYWEGESAPILWIMSGEEDGTC